MFNLVRAGSGALVGIGSGILAPPTVAPIQISGAPGAAGSFALGVDSIFEGVALIGGGLLEWLAPTTLPNLADGLVEGGLTLLARRTTNFAVNSLSGRPQTTFAQAPYYAPAPAYRANGAIAPARYGQVHAPTAGMRGVQSQATGLPFTRAH